MPADPSGERADVAAYRRELRAFIADRGLPMAHEGVRAPRDAGEERAIRRWLRELYDAGYLGAGWPPEWWSAPTTGRCTTWCSCRS